MSSDREPTLTALPTSPQYEKRGARTDEAIRELPQQELWNNPDLLIELVQEYAQALSLNLQEDIYDFVNKLLEALSGWEVLTFEHLQSFYGVVTVSSPSVHKEEIPPENTTSPRTRGRSAVDHQVRDLMRYAATEMFEDGMESEFSRELTRLVMTCGDYAVDMAAYLILRNEVDDEVAAEALKWLGYIDDPKTHDYRQWLLEQALTNKSPFIRDGALLGLDFLGDPSAILALQDAIRCEQISELREDMDKVLHQLERIG